MVKQKTTEEQKHSAFSAFVIRRFKIIAAVLIGALLAAGYLLIVQPERAKLAEKMVNESARATQEKQAKEAALARLERQLQEYAILEKHNSAVLERMLPPISKKEEVIFSLNSIVSSLNFYLTSLVVEDSLTPEEYFGAKLNVPLAILVVPVSTLIQGPTNTYEKMKALLSAIHERYGIFNIKKLELGDAAARTAASESERDVTFNIDLFFRDDTALER